MVIMRTVPVPGCAEFFGNLVIARGISAANSQIASCISPALQAGVI